MISFIKQLNSTSILKQLNFQEKFFYSASIIFIYALIYGNYGFGIANLMIIILFFIFYQYLIPKFIEMTKKDQQNSDKNSSFLAGKKISKKKKK